MEKAVFFPSQPQAYITHVVKKERKIQFSFVLYPVELFEA